MKAFLTQDVCGVKLRLGFYIADGDWLKQEPARCQLFSAYLHDEELQSEDEEAYDKRPNLAPMIEAWAPGLQRRLEELAKASWEGGL